MTMKSRRIIISVAGLPISFDIESHRMRRAVSLRYRGYITKSASCKLFLACTFHRKNFCIGEEIRVQCNGSNRWFIRRNNFDCAWEGKRGKARLYPSVFAFDSLLRVLLSVIASQGGKMIIHAAAIGFARRAIIFPGVSGSGKSTMCRLLNGDQILNDEIVCLGLDEAGRGRVWGTPFWGEMGSGPVWQRPVKAAAIMFLKKSIRHTRIHPMKTAMALTKLLRCCCLFGSDTNLVEKALANASRLVEILPCYELEFRKNPKDIRKALEFFGH
jgi:hypothetical protein